MPRPIPNLKAAFHDIRELKVDVAFPFLLELYHDYDKQMLTKAELLQAARLVESYVFRRAVCGIPTNSMNKTFATFGRGLKKDRYLESIQADFLLLPSYRRFPDDDEFKREISSSRTSTTSAAAATGFGGWRTTTARSACPWTSTRSSTSCRRTRISPRNGRATWGPTGSGFSKTYLHTLGNLTLTGYNPEFSDRPFAEKRDMKGGFGESPLRMNQGLGTLESWNEDAIRQRGERLAALAVNVWPVPKLDPAILEAYKPKAATAGYTIADHHLSRRRTHESHLR